MGGDREALDTKLEILVMVDARWVFWGPLRNKPKENQPPQKHRDFLLRLRKSGTDQPVDAWLLHTPVYRAVEKFSNDGLVIENDRQIAAGLKDPTAPGFGLINGLREQPERSQWYSGSAADEIVGNLIDGIYECHHHADRETIDDPELLADLMNLYTCRIYLTSDQLVRFNPSGCNLSDDFGVPACVDLRFRRHLGAYWLYATLTLWTVAAGEREIAATANFDGEPGKARRPEPPQSRHPGGQTVFRK